MLGHLFYWHILIRMRAGVSSRESQIGTKDTRVLARGSTRKGRTTITPSSLVSRAESLSANILLGEEFGSARTVDSLEIQIVKKVFISEQAYSFWNLIIQNVNLDNEKTKYYVTITVGKRVCVEKERVFTRLKNSGLVVLHNFSVSTTGKEFTLPIKTKSLSINKSQNTIKYISQNILKHYLVQVISFGKKVESLSKCRVYVQSENPLLKMLLQS